MLKLPWNNLFFALIALLVGSLTIQEGIKVYSLACTRSEKTANTCELSQSKLWKAEIKQFPLSQLKEARLEKSSGSKMISVALITENELIHFGSISNFHELEKQKNVSKINAFLQNPSQLTLSVKEPYNFSVISYGLTFSLVGLFMFFYSFRKQDNQ